MELLRGHTGRWFGQNLFRLRPEDPFVAGDATAHLSVGAGVHMAVLTYTWTHPQDGAQEGTLALGRGDEPGVTLGLWSDSWHQKPAATLLRGSLGGDSLTVGYEYAEGWWWWITLSTAAPDLLRWRMDNVVPPSASGMAEPLRYPVMQADLQRRTGA